MLYNSTSLYLKILIKVEEVMIEMKNGGKKRRGKEGKEGGRR